MQALVPVVGHSRQEGEKVTTWHFREGNKHHNACVRRSNQGIA